jgi:hypothetical protein
MRAAHFWAKVRHKRRAERWHRTGSLARALRDPGAEGDHPEVIVPQPSDLPHARGNEAHEDEGSKNKCKYACQPVFCSALRHDDP